MVLVPIYLNEIAPKSLRGAFGVTCQIFVVIGIAIAQFLGLFLSTIPYWRLILLFGGLLSAAHFVLLLFACKSPKWVAFQPGSQLRGSAILQKIRDEDMKCANGDDAVFFLSKMMVSTKYSTINSRC